MNVATTTLTKQDVQGLINAIVQATAEDSLSNPLKPEQWELFSAYLQPCHLAPGQLLINQGANDRTLYFVESGNLSVHYEDEKGRLRMAIVNPGSVVGEGAFYSHRPRGATVQAAAVGAAAAATATTPLAPVFDPDRAAAGVPYDDEAT